MIRSKRSRRPGTTDPHDPGTGVSVADLQRDVRATEGAPALSTMAGPVPSGRQGAVAAASAHWRSRLQQLVQSGAMTHRQEADCLRLIAAFEDRVRDALPRLLEALRPHFGTPGETAAKQRFSEGLQTLKDEQHEELSRLLRSMGLEPAMADFRAG